MLLHKIEKKGERKVCKQFLKSCIYKNSHPELFCECSVKKFVKFTRKHPCWSFFLNKIASLQSATALKKKLRYRCFPVDFYEHFFNTSYMWLRSISVELKAYPAEIYLLKVYNRNTREKGLKYVLSWQ